MLSSAARYARAESRKPSFVFPAEQIFSNLQLRRSILVPTAKWSSKMCTHCHPNGRVTVPREKPRGTFPILPAYRLSRRHLSEMRLDRSPNTRVEKHFQFSLNIDSSIRMVVSLMKYSKPVLVMSREHCPKWKSFP